MLDHGVSEYQVIAITKAILRILNFHKLYLTQQVASISIEHMGSAPLRAAISLIQSDLDPEYFVLSPLLTPNKGNKVERQSANIQQ